MRGAATQAMSVYIVIPSEARDAPLSRYRDRPAGFVARSSHTASGIARRSRLASPALRDSKMYSYFCACPKLDPLNCTQAKPAAKDRYRDFVLGRQSKSR